MADVESAFHSTRVVCPDGTREATVLVGSNGTIVDVVEGPLPPAPDVTDLGDLVLLPGCVDAHVHVNEPGRTDWEGWHTATRAAAAGGVTTIVDMPLNSVPATTTLAGLDAKVDAAAGKALVDYALWGGVVPGNERDLPGLAAAGVAGFKCFLVDSGVPEFAAVGADHLERAMATCAGLGLPVLAHCEDASRLLPPDGDPRSHETWRRSRPPESELSAAMLVARLSAATGCAAHVVHVSSPETVEALRGAIAAGAPLTLETCPHYLGLCSDDVPYGATQFKCAPPLRTAADRDGLRAALVDGRIDLVGSDHSPAPPDTRCIDTGDFTRAWGGIASLQLLPVLVHTFCGEGLGFDGMARVLALAPARLAGIDQRKGAIAPGRDADLVAFDPDATWTVDASRLEHRHKLTPWHGHTLRGRVELTIVRGRTIYDRRNGGIVAGTPAGKLLRRRTP